MRDFLAGFSEKKTVKDRFSKVSVAEIARRSCIADSHLQNALIQDNIGFVSVNRVAKYAVTFSPKVLKFKQFGKTDVFARFRDGRIGRYLFAARNQSGGLKCFFELLERTAQDRIWKCSEVLNTCDASQIRDVVSLVHHCRHHGCHNNICRRISEHSSSTRRNQRDNIRSVPKPSGALVLLIQSCRNRVHRANGPFYIQNFN